MILQTAKLKAKKKSLRSFLTTKGPQNFKDGTEALESIATLHRPVKFKALRGQLFK